MARVELRPHLPAALRYARALTRSRDEGEALVAMALRSLLDGRMALDWTLALPGALFELVHRHWVPFDEPRPADSSEENRLHAALSPIEPWDRAVLLLVRFEEMPTGEAARILHITEAEVRRRITVAERRLLRQPLPRVLIIEAEPDSAGELQEIVVDLGCEVVGPIGSSSQALTLAAVEKPDLIVSGTCGDATMVLDAVAAIRRGREIPVVLVTGTPARLRRQQLDGRIYVAGKPLDRAVLAPMLEQALRRETGS